MDDLHNVSMSYPVSEQTPSMSSINTPYQWLPLSDAMYWTLALVMRSNTLTLQGRLAN